AGRARSRIDYRARDVTEGQLFPNSEGFDATWVTAFRDSAAIFLDELASKSAFVASYKIQPMHYSISTRVFATILLVVVGAPIVCLALPATISPGPMPGGCHGHHEPVPLPSHSCCCARPQLPAQMQIAPLLAPVNLIRRDVSQVGDSGVNVVFNTRVRAD